MDNRIIHWLICAFSKQLRKSYFKLCDFVYENVPNSFV